MEEENGEKQENKKHSRKCREGRNKPQIWVMPIWDKLNWPKTDPPKMTKCCLQEM